MRLRPRPTLGQGAGGGQGRDGKHQRGFERQGPSAASARHDQAIEMAKSMKKTQAT